MDKKIKKLTLSRETLRNLDDHELGLVAGGVTTLPCSSNGTRACSLCTQACSVCCP